MNAFADVMFTLLLGWVRGFINEVWALVTSGAGEGFMSWLGDNWLWIALILCLAGTVLDYAVWFMRWRPYKVWAARLNAFRRRVRGEGRRAKRFNQGYREGVRMDWLEQDEQQAYPPEEYDPRATYVDQDFIGAPQSAPAYDETAYMPPRAEEAYPPVDQPEATRRRRAGRRAVSVRRITGHLTRDDDEDTRMIDGLPPLVDKEQAYHTPVSPTAPTGNRRARREENDDER